MGLDKDDASIELEETEAAKNRPEEIEISVCDLELNKHLGLSSGISLIMGTMIGSGIFVSPKGVLESTGSVGLSLVVWVAAGLIVLMGSLCYCELGTLLMMSGGEYTYIRKAYGDFPAFLRVWISINLTGPSSLAILALTFGSYFASLFEGCGTPRVLEQISAVVCLVTVMLVNCYSTKWAGTIQTFTTVAKILAISTICIGGLYKISQGYTTVLETGFEGSNLQTCSFASGFINALYAYTGWNNLNTVTGELTNPSKNLPRANIISVLAVIVVNSLTSMCYLTVMTKHELLETDAVAVLWGNRVLYSASYIIPLAVVVSTFGAINGGVFALSRSILSASRDGNLPELFSFVNIKHRTPVISISFIIFNAIIFITVMGNIKDLIGFFSFTSWLFFGLTFSTIIVFRLKMKHEPRPYKVRIILPVIMCLISLYLVIAPVIQDPMIEYLYPIGLMLGGALFYFPLVHFKLKVPFFDEFTMYTQLVLQIAPISKDD